MKKELSTNQHFGISMDWSEEHHHVQDTTPTVCGESTTGWRSECVLSDLHFTHSPSPPVTPLPPSPTILPALKVCVEDVNRVFRKQKSRKASGREGISPACLKVCAEQLAPIFTQIFNRSLELCEVPFCFKRSTIIPIPKKPKITGLNDYRPVTLTSVVMKSLERLVLAYPKDITRPLLDPLQFAYRANRSVDDAVNMGLHYILQHLDKPGNYARILFVDFSSALNTIMPDLLSDKLTQLSVPTSICQWIISFLTDRQQLVKLGKLTSRTLTISTGAPQGCVLSPLLFSLYTNDCTSKDPTVKLLKFADDTTVIGLIKDCDESAYRQEVEQLAVWCSLNLELTHSQNCGDDSGLQKEPPCTPPTHHHEQHCGCSRVIQIPGNHHFSGPEMGQSHWLYCEKARQRLYFLRQLRKFNLPQELLKPFYSAIIVSVLCSSITVWFGSATKTDIRRLQQTGLLRGLSVPLCPASKNFKSLWTPHTQLILSLNCCPLAGVTDHWAPKQPDTRTVFSPRPYPTWTTHNTPGTVHL